MYLNPLARGLLYSPADGGGANPSGSAGGNSGSSVSQRQGEQTRVDKYDAASTSAPSDERHKIGLSAFERIQSTQVSATMRGDYVKYLLQKLASGLSHPAERTLLNERLPLIEVLSSKSDAPAMRIDALKLLARQPSPSSAQLLLRIVSNQPGLDGGVLPTDDERAWAAAALGTLSSRDPAIRSSAVALFERLTANAPPVRGLIWLPGEASEAADDSLRESFKEIYKWMQAGDKALEDLRACQLFPLMESCSPQTLDQTKTTIQAEAIRFFEGRSRPCTQGGDLIRLLDEVPLYLTNREPVPRFTGECVVAPRETRHLGQQFYFILAHELRHAENARAQATQPQAVHPFLCDKDTFVKLYAADEASAHATEGQIAVSFYSKDQMPGRNTVEKEALRVLRASQNEEGAPERLKQATAIFLEGILRGRVSTVTGEPYRDLYCAEWDCAQKFVALERELGLFQS